MKKIRFAVVGCGHIGSRHLAILDSEPQAILVAACDIKKEVIDEVATKYKVDCYQNFKDMVIRDDIDVINICTPHHLHKEMMILAAKYKKHVLVEKPMALKTKDCEKMIEAAKKNNTKLWVVKQNRYNSSIKILRELIENKALGKVFLVECNVLWNRRPEYYSDSDWRGRKKNEGGALYTQVSHFIDLLLWLFGDIKKIQSVISRKKQKIETEDLGSSLIRFNNGAIGGITWTTDVYNKNLDGGILVVAEKGTIRIGGYLNKIDYWDVDGITVPPYEDSIDKVSTYKNYQGTNSKHEKVIQEVIASLNGEVNSLVDGKEAMKTIKIIEKMYEKSARW